MSKKYSYNSDDEMNENSKSNHNNNKKNINDLLVKALADASNPGFGDEEPEVLEAPPTSDRGVITEYKRGSNSDIDELQPDAKHLRNHENNNHHNRERNRLMKDEEDKALDMHMSIDKPNLINSQNMSERAKYIPVRLTYEERKSLRLVNAAISVSDYTTAVDVEFKNKTRRSHLQLQYIVAFLTGSYKDILRIIIIYHI